MSMEDSAGERNCGLFTTSSASDEPLLISDSASGDSLVQAPPHTTCHVGLFVRENVKYMQKQREYLDSVVSLHDSIRQLQPLSMYGHSRHLPPNQPVQ